MSDYLCPLTSEPSKQLKNSSDSWCRTKFHVVNHTFVWSIENFSLAASENGESIVSSKFVVGKDKETFWWLKMYPRGATEFSSSHIGIFLEMSSSDHNQTYGTRAEISVINSRGALTFSSTMQKTFRNEDSHGIDKFLSLETLSKYGTAVLPNDTFSVYCFLSICSGQVTKCGERDTNAQCPCGLSADDLSHDYEKLWESKRGNDVTLRTEDGNIKAHKIILSARSETFYHIFQEDPTAESIRISDVDHDVAEEIVYYIYCDKIHDLSKNFARKLYAAAEKYHLKKLQHRIVKFLTSKLELGDVPETLLLARRYKDEALENMIIEFIGHRINDVIEMEIWKKYSEDEPDLVANVLQQLQQKATITK